MHLDRSRNAGRVQDRGQDVDRRDHCLASRGLRDAGPADEEGDAQARLVDRRLAAVERRAVIAGQDDQGVVGPTQPLEGLEQQPDAGIDAQYFVVIASDALALLRSVDSLEWEDRLLARLDQGCRNALVLVQEGPVRYHFICLRVALAVGVRVGVVHHQEEGIFGSAAHEFLGRRGHSRHVTSVHLRTDVPQEAVDGVDMQLADQAGAVAGSLEYVGHRGVVQVWVQAEVRGVGEAELAVAVHVEAGEHGAP